MYTNEDMELQIEDLINQFNNQETSDNTDLIDFMFSALTIKSTMRL